MNGDSKYWVYKLIKHGISMNCISSEVPIDDLVVTVDCLIKPEFIHPDSKYKGIVLEFNGPTHYYFP